MYLTHIVQNSKMKKETIIIIIIIILIITTDYFTQKYTKESVLKISQQLESIKEIAEDFEDTNDGNQNELYDKLDELQDNWKTTNKKLSFYIEHEELEKVNSSIIKIRSYFFVDEVGEAIPELENCKFILEHIKDKEAIRIINLF